MGFCMHLVMASPTTDTDLHNTYVTSYLPTYLPIKPYGSHQAVEPPKMWAGLTD